MFDNRGSFIDIEVAEGEWALLREPVNIPRSASLMRILLLRVQSKYGRTLRRPYASGLGAPSSKDTSCSATIGELSLSSITESKALWSASPKRPSRVNGLENSVTICA